MIKEDIDWVEEVARQLDDIYTILFNINEKLGELEAGQDMLMEEISNAENKK